VIGVPPLRGRSSSHRDVASIPFRPLRRSGARRFFAARERSVASLVRTAFFADVERLLAIRLLVAFRACLDSARLDAAERPDFFKVRALAADRFADFLAAVFFLPALRSLSAFFRTSSDAFSLGGALTDTPALRAFARPIAIACLVDFAPCLPCRTCRISSRTYSPACVLADLPDFLARFARCRVLFSGMAAAPCGFRAHLSANVMPRPFVCACVTLLSSS
jgi:hypothetical protein